MLSESKVAFCRVFDSKEQAARVYRELGLIKKTIDKGDMEDIEF